MEPSLSSTSETKTSPCPTRALAKGASSATKFFITAPFMIVGSRPASVNIQPIMPVTVDLPLVPPIATLRGAVLNRLARSSARVMRAQPSAFALAMSGTLSSIAADAIRIWSPFIRPLPSCGKRSMPRLCSHANFGPKRPWSSARSEPATFAPASRTILAKGNMPEPPMPQKK